MPNNQQPNQPNQPNQEPRRMQPGRRGDDMERPDEEGDRRQDGDGMERPDQGDRNKKRN